ncbi:hypothetical protein K488DRAFT_70022 [Vararia minispora EC-137]|uniref:Uncharacterized protein n=1 Tax=Vararia minispora EC-137 TaxID=1314806 RepID=A0ACB8QNE0_9AGAM|nr:hypothetical protein K488DRAFT_70022 [Vararia minispora EC-137]
MDRVIGNKRLPVIADQDSPPTCPSKQPGKNNTFTLIGIILAVPPMHIDAPFHIAFTRNLIRYTKGKMPGGHAPIRGGSYFFSAMVASSNGLVWIAQYPLKPPYEMYDRQEGKTVPGTLIQVSRHGSRESLLTVFPTYKGYTLLKATTLVDESQVLEVNGLYSSVVCKHLTLQMSTVPNEVSGMMREERVNIKLPELAYNHEAKENAGLLIRMSSVPFCAGL